MGEQFSARDLTRVMLAASSNDAAYALAEAVTGKLTQNNDVGTARQVAETGTVSGGKTGTTDEAHADEARALEPFITLMDQMAEQLGFANMEFLNPTGLDESDALSGAYGTAHDVARLAMQVVAEDSEVIELTRSAAFRVTSRNGHEHRFKNTNTILSQIPGIIGTKTGFTDLAGGNLLVLFDVGVHHPVIAVVLGSSLEGRFTDMMQLVNATYALFAR
ncbi:MAG: D-alanyl-D-alanine carboxypeptidase [Parcubacteria group bacterium]|nr:D-alanyl-D-alanine carboxypeptidase [Parcubacteria group bacterium]